MSDSPFQIKNAINAPSFHPRNQHQEVTWFSSELPYDKVITSRHMPYTAAKLLHLAVYNLPFERYHCISGDLAVLMDYINSLIPQHVLRLKEECVAQRAQNPLFPYSQYENSIDRCARQPCFARFMAMDPQRDMETDENGLPCKKRRIIIQTNYPFLTKLLRDPCLYILCDRSCFHVCWHGSISQRVLENGEKKDIVHDVDQMQHYCTTIRGMGRAERHKATAELPCTAVRFDYPKDVPQAHQGRANEVMWGIK